MVGRAATVRQLRGRNQQHQCNGCNVVTHFCPNVAEYAQP